MGYYKTSGSASNTGWSALNGTTGTSWNLTGNTGTTAGTNFVGTTDAVDLVFKTNGTERMRVLSAGNVGIGTASPAGLLHVSSSTAATGLSYYTQANASADGFDQNYRKARGTATVPMVITAADELGVINFTGYSGVSGYITGAAIKGISSGTIADNRVPGQLSFLTGTNAAPSVLTERMTIDNAGNVGIGTVTPVGKLQIAAGTITIAPLVLTNGNNLTIPVAGAIEFDGTEFYHTPLTTRYIIPSTLKGSAVLDFPSTAGGAKSDLTITVAGAADGDAIFLGVPNASTVANGAFSAWVSAADTVIVRFANNDLVSALDPTSGTFKVTVNK